MSHETQGQVPGRVSSYLWPPPLALLVAVALWLAACGGGDSSSKATTDYKAGARAAAAKLGKQTDALIKDMQAAQTSQSDPKWAGILNGDSDLVTSAATELKALTPPAGAMTTAQSRLARAADQLISAAALMKQTVETGDAATGAQAYLGLTQGRGSLTDASAAVAK